MPLAPSQENTKIQDHVLKFIQAKDKAGYVLDLFDEWVVNNPQFPPRADVSYELRKVTSAGGKVLLEGPQSYFLSNAAEKIWDSGTSANTDASGMLCASRARPALDPPDLWRHALPPGPPLPPRPPPERAPPPRSASRRVRAQGSISPSRS